jgi:methionyl-tRNA synthetase
MSKGKYYLTTPIYYVNAAPHIGHAYTSIAAEAIARFKRMQGFDVVLTTGTDEHGTKVERSAKAQGKSPEEFVELISNDFRQTWQKLDLQMDRFQRTTNANHARLVNSLFEACKQNGFIYKGTYTGMYSVVSEAFVNDAKPGDIDPDSGKPYEEITEENYFFKLSAFTDRLLEFYENNPSFMLPEIRRNEILAFVKQGLADISITRTSIKWGVPVESDPAHVFYVWFDALTTYVSAVDGENRWPADLHLIGKEILRFHTVFWPAFLMAAGWDLPKQVFAHGWLLFEESKMSKTRGNIVRPLPIADTMGVDALRYFLLREIVFGSDGNFSFDALVNRYNSDLANGLGNLSSRSLTMLSQFRQGAVPASFADAELAADIAAIHKDVIANYEAFEFSKALERIWTLITKIDKLIVTVAPWKLAKDPSPEAQQSLDRILYTALESLRIITGLVSPVLPHSAQRIWEQLGYTDKVATHTIEEFQWAAAKLPANIGEIGAVFPRLEAQATVQKMQDLEEVEKARQATLLGQAPKADEPAVPIAPIAPTITIDDFTKVDLRVGQVKSAEKVKGADKLLHLKVDIGEPEPRTIVAGIALAYQPEQLVGRKVVIVANLEPRKLRGLTSQGMIVAASLEGGSPALASFLESVPVGARLK